MSWNARRCRGGNGWETGEFPADDADGMNKRELVGIVVGPESCFVHQAANGEMGHHQAVEFLADQVWRLAS